jgi:hypothetical protein
MSEQSQQMEKTRETIRFVKQITDIAKSKEVAPEVAILADAVLHLYKLSERLLSKNSDAFDQIQELDKRQGSGDGQDASANR